MHDMFKVDYPNDKLDTFHKKKQERHILNKNYMWIRKEVNQFDKKHGVDLQNPDIWYHPSYHKTIVFADVDRAIRSLICILNGISPKKFLGEDPMVPVSRTILHDKEFTEYSILNWESKSPISTTSKEFRCKFVSLLVSSFIGNTETIAKNYCRAGILRIQESEREIMAARSLLHSLERLTFSVVSKRNLDYSTYLVDVLKWLTYKDHKHSATQYNTVMDDHLTYTKKYAKKDPFTRKPYYQDDELIMNILETSYMVTTGVLEDKYGYLPKFRYVKGATRKHNIIMLIEALGGAILAECGAEKTTPGYRAYKASIPLVFTEHGKAAKENRAIREGLYALSYLQFLYNDKIMTNFMKELYKKGK